MNKKMLWRNILLVCFVLGLCVAALGFAVTIQTDKLDKTGNQVEHTHHIINESKDLVIHVKGMLVEQRGYLLTGDQESFRQYEDRKGLVSTHIATLKELVADNPSQVSRIDEIQHHFLKLADSLEKTVQSYGPLTGTDIADMETVNQLKNDIVRLSNDLLEEEYDLLASRVGEVEAQRDQYVMTFIVGGVLVAILLIVLNIFLMRAQIGKGVAERDLRETEERLRLALEGTNDGIYDWSIKTDRIVFSDQFWRMLGYGPDELESSYENYKALIHPEDLERVEEQTESYLDGIVSEYSIAFRMRHKSGQ